MHAISLSIEVWIIILSILDWNIWLLIADLVKSEHSLKIRNSRDAWDYWGVFLKRNIREADQHQIPIILTLDAYNRSGLWAYACLCPYTVHRCMRNVSSKEENLTRFDISESFSPFELCKAVINRCRRSWEPTNLTWYPQTHAISLSCSARDVLPVRESTCFGVLLGLVRWARQSRRSPSHGPSRKCLIWKCTQLTFPSLVHVLTAFRPYENMKP